MRWNVIAAGLLFLAYTGTADTPRQSETRARREVRTRWWREARFGLFIHWGPVSLTGKEISWSRANSNPKCPNRGPTPVKTYDNLYRQFNPVHFDAAEWVRLAREAGTKYIVLTAKHCDGFLLWHSRTSRYNISASPFQRDICRELADAARRQRMKIGWYFSPMDWRDPDFRTDRNAEFVTRMQAEVREVLSDYGRIDLLWFDWDGGDPLYDQAGTYQIVKQLQPAIVVNNRLDLGKSDSNRKILSPNADYYTPEQESGSFDNEQPWESCMTLGTQWSWKPDDRIKSVAEVVRILASCAGGDGNLLLNVGPMPDGTMEPRQAAVLRGVGEWLDKYGESIYATRGGPYRPGNYGATTRKGSTVYVHVFHWPEGPLRLPAIPARLKGARVLSGGKAFARQTGDVLEISVLPGDRTSPVTVVALQLDRPAAGLPAVPVSDSTPRQ